jgi:CHAT domain-containing protein
VALEGEFLIERNVVAYSPSASVMPYCVSRRSPVTGHAFVAGDSRGDLAHARHEAGLVAEQFGVDALVTSEVRRSVVLDRLRAEGRIDVVHLACHGYFDEVEPFRSGILMASDGADQDLPVLTAKDLGDVTVRADLVTLSACQSGVNENRVGDELIGLTRAILHAGAASVLVSLWRVDDYSTAMLMAEFYRRLRAAPDRSDGWAKAQALRSAQLFVLSLTAQQVSAALTTRLEAGGDDATTADMLTLDLAAAHARAGDVPGALEHCDRVADRTAVPALGLQATRLAENLRFERAVQERQGRLRPVDWNARMFEHPAYWASFVLVGDWA